MKMINLKKKVLRYDYHWMIHLRSKEPQDYLENESTDIDNFVKNR